MSDQSMRVDTRVFASPDSLADEVAEWLCALAQSSQGEFRLGLSGGSTPKRLYQRLAYPDIAARFPWDRVHFFWSDERFVPHDDPNSNYRMTYDALLAHAPVIPANVHAVPTENLTPDQAAAAYEATMKRAYGAEVLDPARPFFDVMLLGIGEDGHTASLFPNTPALHEDRHWAVAVTGAAAQVRITLTYPILNSSRELVFLATGAAKREIIKRAQARDPGLPASHVQPAGRQHWFIDKAAAGA